MPNHCLQLSIFHSAVHFALRILFAHILPFVIFLLSPAQSELDLCYPPLVKIDFKGHQGESAFANLSREPLQLPSVNEELSVPQRLVVAVSPLRIFGDMEVDEKKLFVKNPHKAVTDIDFSVPKRLYLGPLKDHTGFKLLFYMEFVKRFLVLDRGCTHDRKILP